MKLAVVSDLHFGDPESTLVVREGPHVFRLGPGFERLRAQLAPLGTLDYLVLLGDVFDFSVASWALAYQAAIPFLRAVADLKLAKEIIYLPGNHDFSAWNHTMHQANVIDAVTQHQVPRDRWSVPAVIDSRMPGQGIWLSGVTRQPAAPHYGGLFLDKLGDIRFYVAYPNLYIVDKAGSTTLVTHGHYFEGYWAITSRLGPQIFGNALQYASRTGVGSIEELVAVNFPLNELSSSGTGQAGPLSPVIRGIQLEQREGKHERMQSYIKNARALMDQSTEFKGLGNWLKELATDTILNVVSGQLVKFLAKASTAAPSPARYNEAFFQNPETRDNIRLFLDACMLELETILERDKLPVPFPSRVLFGHTHVPILSSDPNPPSVLHEKSGRSIPFWNTGGWLQPDGPARAAALFVYDDGDGEASAQSTSGTPSNAQPASPWRSILIPAA